MTDFIHKTVLLKEAVESLNCRRGNFYIDATAGGGGHSFEIAKKLYPDGRLVMFDTDPDAINAASIRLGIHADYPQRLEGGLCPSETPFNAGNQAKEIITIIRANYSEIPQILNTLNIDKIDGGILFDLGVSYHQLTSKERGFSFSKDFFLDMRMNPDNATTAYDIVNKYSEKELYRIFKEFGEERFSRRIARKIAEIRKIKEIRTTGELAEIIIKTVPYSKNRKRIHPATKVFQALRIEVNQELAILEKTLHKIIPLLAGNARIVVISFHSLEDRLVKNIFKHYASKCVCPPLKLICECEEPMLKLITKKPIIPSEDEIKMNPSARSAKMRVAERVI